MTSTNDGSNLRSGQKDKRYYIESFQNLEARLNGPASAGQRTQNVCEAWRLVHGLCSHSTPDTRSHLLSWIQRNTAYAILQDEWRSPANKPQHVELEKAINDFILECHKTDTILVWETTLLRRAVWYKSVLSNPWGHAVLKALLDPKGIQPTDQEVIGWLREERAMMFVTRLRVMARAKRLIDLALVLVSAVMTRARRVAPAQSDASHADTAPGVQGGSKGSNFVETLSREAGFTKDVWELLIDIEFVLLHKQDQSTCIDLAKKIPLKDGKRIVERLRFRLDKSPSDKKLWKKAKDVAILIAQVVITRCMVVTSCAGAVLDALTGCASALAQLLDGSRLPQAAAALAAPAATAAHLYAFADAIAHQCKDKIDRQPFICELYVRAITAGMNELERLKLEKDKEPEVCALQHTLSGWFTKLGEVLSSSARLRCECMLTAFSLHPSANMYELVVALPLLAAPDKSPKRETSEVTSEFGSWATDSRTSSNFVKTSETLNLKQNQKQTNILSSSMFDTECDALGLKSELCEDLAVLLSGPRVKTLSWDMDRETLLENCRLYKERTQEGTRALTTELKYLNLDPKSYDHLPEEEDDEDNYYGIEKGYELSLEYEDIWSDNNIDYTERCESACSISTIDSTKTSTKPKNRKNPVKYYDDEIDPLSVDTEANCNQSTSENSKNLGKKQNEGIKKKSKAKKCDDPDSKKLSESDQEKELLKKQKRKERRERKKREKMEMLLKQELQIGMDDNTNLIDTKILSAGIEPVKERRKQNTVRRTQHVSATDSDYDSQGKSSLASINSEGNDTSDVLFDGLFSMDEIRSPEKTTFNNLSLTFDTNKEQKITKQKRDNQKMVTDKLKKLLQFRHHKKQINFHKNSTEVSTKYIENINSTSNSNIYRPEGITPQVQGASPNVCNTSKTTEPEKLNNNLKQSEKFDCMNASKRNLSGNNNIKKNYVAPSQKQAARTSGLLISDPHQKQFQEFLKLQNVPIITYNATKQNKPTTTKVIQSELAQRNPVLTGLIQQKSELCHNVNSVKDINEPGSSLLNSEVLKLQNLPIVETKKHLKPQKHGVDNVPKTFSRLSYMHKNKQADMKYKQLNEQEQVKTQIAKIIDNDSFVKINNLQAKGEILISKALKRNSMTINRDNPMIRQGDRIPNPSTSTTMHTKDLRLNIVNVSKVTKEIVENKVIIKKDPKTTMPVDLQYIIHQTNLDVGSNWKSQYPNTTIEKSTDVSPLNIGNLSNEDKVVVLGVANKETTNDMAIQQENSNKVIVSHLGQFNSKDDSRATLHKEGKMENSEDWKFVMNKLRSLKSEKRSVDALEMALSSNSSIKGRAEILRNLHKYALSSKGIDSRDHINMPSKQKVRTSLIDSKQTVIKNEIAQKPNQPGIVKKITKKAVAKCNDPTKSLAISKTLKTSNVVMPRMHNSDYDQLDDLIDDELRQEIEESSPLNSEVPIIYGSARVTTAIPEKEKPPKTESSKEINFIQSSNVNKNMKQTSGQSSMESVLNPVTRTCSVIKENTQGSALKPKLHTISDQILSPYTKSSSSKNEKCCSKSNTSENRSSVIAERPMSYTQKIPCVTGGNISNMSIITSPINIVHPANVILRNVSHINQPQNLMLITPTNTISHSNHPIRIIEQELPLTSNVSNQTAYVLKPQNTCLFSSPQITAQGLNPSIIGNATTNVAPSMSYTDSPIPHQEYVSANKRTEVIRQSNLIGHELYVNHTKKDSKIESNRLKEEKIQSYSINQNIAQYCDEILKTNVIDGQALPICPNKIRDCNIDILNQPIIEKHFKRTDETSNTITKSETEFIHPKREIMSVFPNKNEFHQNDGHLPKIVSIEETKYDFDSSKPNETIATESDVIENKPENINKKKERSPSILGESYDKIIDTEFTTAVGSEIAKTGIDYICKEKERSPSILSESCDQIIDVGREIAKTEKGEENNDCKQSYKENDLKVCVEESLEIDNCSKNDKRPKLEGEVCKSQEVKILNEPMESTLSTKVVTDRVYENEKNSVAKMSRTKSYNSDKPNMSVTIYIPQKKIFESSTIDNMPTKFCERKVLSQVQENQLVKASEITENKKNLKNKHSLDYKLHSDKEADRLRNKRLSIIHREINHYIVSEPIALMYAPIHFEKSISNDKITKAISPSQNNVTGKTEQRLKLDNKSDEITSKITSAEESSLNRERFIDKSNNIPTRRLRSSNSFRSSKCTALDESKLSLPNSEQQINYNNTIEAKKAAPKRSSENDPSTDNSTMKIQKNELRDDSHNINVNNKQKYIDEIHRNSNVIRSTADSNTIDLTDTEPTDNLHSIKKVSDCGLLNREVTTVCQVLSPVTTVKNTIPLDRPIENVCKPKQSVQKIYHRPTHKMSQETNLEKEVTVLDIKELPSPNGDSMKKILRIKLSNGNIFRATVTGNLKVDIKTVLSEPSIKSLLNTNILQSKSCTVNVKHITDFKNDTRKKEVTISSVHTRKPDPVNTEVIELSDDEDENIYYFKTEFGTYKTKSIDSKAYEKHQNKFSQKCTVQIQKSKIVKNMNLNSHKKSLPDVIMQNDIGSETKIGDVTNECGNMNDKITNYSETIKVMEQSEINSEPPYSKTESISDTLQNLQSTLLESQKVQLHNVCRVNLARCDQQLKYNDCCISSPSVLNEPKGSENSPLNEEDNDKIPIIRSNSFSLLSDIEKLDGNTLRSESSSLSVSRAKHGSILPSFDQNCCNSDWILCTKSMYSLEAKRIMQRKCIKSVHDFRVKPHNLEESKSSDSFLNLSGIEKNDKIIIRSESPSIIADFESQAKQSSCSWSFDQSRCNSDWMLCTKATIHSLEVKQQKCVKAVLDSHVKVDINLDSSTDCDSDLEFHDNHAFHDNQKNEEQKFVFQVPPLLSLAYTLITSDVDILERYINQKNKNSHIMNSPIHNLKRKHNTSDKINNCKISKTDGNTPSCNVNVPLTVVVDKQDNNVIKSTTRELEHQTIVETMILYKKDGMSKFANKKANEANLDKNVDFVLISDSRNNNNIHTYEENVSNLKFEITNKNNLPVNKTSRELQTLSNENNSNKNQLEFNDQKPKDAMENIREVPSQMQNIEKRRELEYPKMVETMIQHTKDCMPKFATASANETNRDENEDNVVSVSRVLCHTSSKLENPTIVKTTTEYIKDTMPKFFNEANIDKNIDNIISASKVLNETDYSKNIDNYEREESERNSELEVSQEFVTMNNTNRDIQIFIIKNDSNKNQLKCNDEKPTDIMENQRKVQTQTQDIEKRRELEHLKIDETTIQHTKDCMPKFTTASANETNLDENEDNVSVSKVLCHTGSKLENPTIVKTTIQYTKDTMPKTLIEANIDKNIDDVISASKVLCETEYSKNINEANIDNFISATKVLNETDYSKNVNNHEREENESISELEVSQEEYVTMNNTNRDMQIFIIKNDTNKHQLKCNDEKSTDVVENQRKVQMQMKDIEKRRELEHPKIDETLIQHTTDCMPKFATASANETNLDENEDNVVSVSKVLCHTGSSSDVDNYKCRWNHTDNNILKSNILFPSQHTDNNKVIKVNINNVVDETSSTDVAFELEKNKNNEDTMANTIEIITIQGESNSIPLIVSKKANDVNSEYNLCNSQEVVPNNEDTMPNTLEIITIKDESNSIPLVVSEKANDIKSEYNLCNSQEVVAKAKVLCDSEKLTQDFDENTNDEKKTENENTIQTKMIAQETCKKFDRYAVETPLKPISGKNNLKDKSIITTEYDTCGTEDMLEESLVTAGIEIPSEKLLNSSKCMNVTILEATNYAHTESFSNNMTTKNNTIETDTSISYKIELSNASEEKAHILDKDHSPHQSLIITNSEEKVKEAEHDCENFCRNPTVHQTNEVANSYVSFNNSTGSFMSPACFLEPEKNKSENQLQKIHPEGNENTSGISESKTIIENFTDNNKIENNNRRKNEDESVTLIYKGNSNVVLKGSPYVDPVVGTCYIFPLSSSTCSRKEFTSLNANQTINMIKSLKKKNLNENDNTMIEQSNFSLILPKITYSRFYANQSRNSCSNTNTRQLKRKSDSKNDCKLERKYRKGKNIDTCKQTTKMAYVDQYKRLLEYCTSIKFSYSRPFHKSSIDPACLLKNWPIQNSNSDNYSTATLEEAEKLIFIDINKENKTYVDPLQQTLAEEIAMEYNNANEYSQFSQTEDSNFNMGFGEVSDRVIQNLANGIYTSKFSAATLSDVKLPQPLFTTRDKKQNIPQIIKKSNDEELANMKRCISFIQLRDKVKDFFRKSASELHGNLNSTKRSSKTILYDLISPQFFNPPKQVAVVNVVQVGQLPVSASAQNPVTCDPRVTHVSNASPPQCSAENSPDGDQNASKTEYTELTTADLSLPLVQEYQQSSQVIMSSQSQLSVPVASKVSMDINCESKLEHQEEIEAKNENTDVTNNFLPEHKNIPIISYSYNPENDSFKSGNSYKSENDSYKSENDSYKSDSIHKTEKKLCKPESNTLQSDNSRTLDIESQNAIFDSLLKENNDYVFKAKTTNGTSEKSDQIAHAMNAAGITTGTDSISNNNRAQALVNILSQKIRQNTVNTTQTSGNSYTKGSPINAMALQQALAQILPPPLNQTNSSDHQNASITPQVLHIVQGKNTSGNQITIVDNQQNSVINNSNNTPVLHIVQNKSAIGNSTSNSNTATQNSNSFSGLSLLDAGIQQGGNQLLHIVNTGQKNNTSGQLLKRVNLLTNLTNVQGNNEQKMVQFVCKSADGKSIQLNAPHQRSMVLRLQPIESTNVPNAAKSEGQDIIQSSNFVSTKENNNTQQQEIKSRSVYEENYAKFIQNSSPKPSMPEKSTSLPKFNQAFGKQVFQDNNQKNNEMQSNSSSHVANTNTSTENVECSSNDNAINLEHINQINSPPLLLRKSPAQTSQQGQSNLVQQIKQTIAPVNIQTMHGGVIYTRQIPVNIGGGQTINLITVPSTDLIDETGQKQQSEVKFVNQNEIEPSIIKIVPQSQNSSTSEGASEDNNTLNATNDTPHTTTATHTQPVLTQMRIKLPMLSKTPQMVSGARLVRPSFFQIQRNVIGGANQPVYQQLVLTAAPSLGQQTVRPPQAQPTRVKTTTENQTSSESQMSSSTLEQLREFDMVLEQVKERSTVQPNSNTNNTYTKLQSPTESTDSNTPASVITTEPTQQVLYSIGSNNSLNVAYVNRKPAATTPATSTFARSPDSSGVADSPTSSTHVQIPAHSSSNETSSDTSPQQGQPKPKSSSKSKSRPKTSSNPTTSMKINTVPPKTSTQKPLEDEQTTQRILYILAEYKEQVENSPDKDKPAPRRRSNPPSNPGSSKRKKSSSGSRRPGGRDMSPIHGEDTCRTMGSEDSSCGTSQGDCTENCLETHSPQDSPRKVVRKLTFENETSNATPRQQPARNVIVADGQTITVARGTAGKPATAVLMPANYILPVSMVKGGQQIAIVTNRGPKILTVGGEGGGNALLLQRLIGPAGLKPVLSRPGVRHVRLPTAALHNLQAFNIATAANVQPPDSAASPAPEPPPPDLVETRTTSSPWPDRDSQDVKPERSSSPEGSEAWNLPSSADPHDYSYEETVRAENLDRTVLDAIPDRYSPDLEAQRIFDKMFDVDTKKSYIDSQDDSPRCGYDIDASDCDDKGYQQVVQKRDQRQHRLGHVSAAALRHKYAILEHELRLQKSLSEECEDLGVDSPSASELFPEAELLFASSPAHESSHHGHTPQPGISQSTIPQPDMDDQIATDQLLNRTLQDDHQDLDVTLGLDEGIVTVSEDGMQATITLDQEEFARSHPNTTFHSEPTEEENVQPYTVSGIKGRHITSTIFHAGRAPATVLMTAPQTTVISQAMPDQQHTNIKYIDNIMNPGHNNICLSSVLVKDDGLTKYDNILNDSRELHLSNTASAIVHSNTTQVIRRVCYDDDKRDSRFLLDETDALIAGDDAKMIAEDSSRDATLESIADDRSSPERHTELFWESNSASERSDSRRPLDFSSDSDKCCKSPLYDETNSTDSSGVGTHMRLDSVIKDARGLDRSGSADNSSADDTLPPLRTYPPKRMYHVDGEMERSVSGKTRAGERSPDGHEVRRRASVRGVVKRGCHCCNGSPAPPRPKKSRQKKPSIDFNN